MNLVPPPMGWRRMPLSKLCTIVSGATPSRARPEYWNGRIAWATPKDISGLVGSVLQDTQEHISSLGYESCSATLLPKGSVLFSSRAPIGLVAIAGREMCTNQGFKSLVPGSDIEPKFLFWTMQRLAPQIAALGAGSTFKEVSKRIVAEFEIDLPPLGEQRRIAEILDKADAIRRKSEDLLALADSFLRAAFIYLVGHKNDDYETWPTYPIRELAAQHAGAIRTGPFGSDLRHSEFVEDGVAVLGIDNAVNNRFCWGERRFITEAKYEQLKRYRVYPRDVIITIMGTVGRSAVIPDDISQAITTKHLATITVDHSKILPEFLSFAIHSDPLMWRQIERANKGAIMPGLNLSIIKGLEIRLPPVESQRRFALLSEKIQAMKSCTSIPASSGEQLFNSLAQRAFRGRL
ncbi:MAG TPA: restriction endonuclease subunit S [Bryobacteraceae bacterium]|nr:restriction endonuclease subunit S [Bryobacteraceae bacterium]